MASEGPNSPSTNTLVDYSSGIAVSNPGNVYASDDAYLTGSTLGNNQYLYVYRFGGFGFSVPSGAAIDGIEAVWEGHGAQASGTPFAILSANLYDGTTRLTGAGDLFGEKSSNITGSSDSTFTQGGAADTWNASPALDDTVVNGSGFSISAIFAQAGGGQIDFSIDHVTVTVYYTDPSGGHGMLVGMARNRLVIPG